MQTSVSKHSRALSASSRGDANAEQEGEGRHQVNLVHYLMMSVRCQIARCGWRRYWRVGGRSNKERLREQQCERLVGARRPRKAYGARLPLGGTAVITRLRGLRGQ